MKEIRWYHPFLLLFLMLLCIEDVAWPSELQDRWRTGSKECDEAISFDGAFTFDGKVIAFMVSKIEPATDSEVALHGGCIGQMFDYAIDEVWVAYPESPAIKSFDRSDLCWLFDVMQDYGECSDGKDLNARVD
jgi:hypothetical protein